MRKLSIMEKITKRTLFQSVVLGLIGGPLIWLIEGEWTLFAIVWDCCAMFLAPILVDGIRPTFVRVEN